MLKGSDPVLSLMDKRVRDIFKAACTFEIRGTDHNANANTVPQAMRSGIRSKAVIAPGAVQKNIFNDEVAGKATRLGFGIVVEDLVDTTYDAFKVIDHCIKVHEEPVFTPILNELKAERE